MLSELEDIVGEANVSQRDSDKIAYGVDYFWVGRMWADRGQPLPAPDFIVRPATAPEVAGVLRVANYYKIPVYTWGGGSGSQGGALPMSGGIILDTKRMDSVVEYDEVSMKVTVEAGMNFQQLEWYANERGHSLMHYPSSLTCATVGGFLAHRGIGVLSNKYGKIDDMCLAMEIVLPDGTIIDTLPVPKHAAGPDLAQIFIGSEGTLGVITKATFKLYEQPEERRFRAFIFKDISSGIAAGKEIMRKVKPSIIRLYDEAETVSIIKEVLGVQKSGAFMNTAVEGIPEMVDLEERILVEICLKHGGEDLGGEWGKKWWDHRITFFYPGHIMNNPQDVRYDGLRLQPTTDMENIYWAMKHSLEDNFPGVQVYRPLLALVRLGHACSTTASSWMSRRRTLSEAIRLHNQIWNAGVRAAIANGGVINDHHGIGLKLSRLMKEQYGPAMQVMEGIKKSA